MLLGKFLLSIFSKNRLIKKTCVFCCFFTFHEIKNFDSTNLFYIHICYSPSRNEQFMSFLGNSMVGICRLTYWLLGCFHKSFSNLKVKNPDVPLRKFFRFSYFVPHGPNYYPPNFCAIKMIFDRDRAWSIKVSHEIS